MFQYVLAILSVIAVIGIIAIVPFELELSFAFHTPGSGYTIIGGQVYASNGTDTNALAPLFVRPQNDTLTFANQQTALPQPVNGTADFANQQTALPQPVNGTADFANQQTALPQPVNGTQNPVTSSPSDIVSQLNLARQAVELGDPDTILKSLDFIQQQLPFLATQNNTTNFSNMSNIYGSTDLQAESTQNMTKNQPEAPEELYQ